MLDQKVIEQGERFKGMSKEILPLINQIEEVLKKYEVSDLASLTVDAKTGYFTFSTHESDWEMSRSDNECPVRLRYSFSEEIDLEETKEKQEPVIGFVDLQKEA